jgi:hypothetical protein
MYTAGNPVMLVDPDGREIIKSKTKYKTMKDGSERQLKWLSFRKADRVETRITVKNMKIIDLTGRVSAEDLASEAKGIQEEITKYWSTSGRDDADLEGYITNKRGQKLRVTTTFENDISVATNKSSIKRKDHVIAIVDNRTMAKHGGSNAAMTLFGGRMSSNIMLNTKGNMGTGFGDYAHEFGHMLGLNDVMIYRSGIENRRLMYNGAAPFGHNPWKGVLKPMPPPSFYELKVGSNNSTTTYNNINKL